MQEEQKQLDQRWAKYKHELSRGTQSGVTPQKDRRLSYASSLTPCVTPLKVRRETVYTIPNPNDLTVSSQRFQDSSLVINGHQVSKYSRHSMAVLSSLYSSLDDIQSPISQLATPSYPVTE